MASVNHISISPKLLTSKLNPRAPDKRLYTNLAWPYTMVTMVTVNTMCNGHTYLSEVIPTSQVVRVDEWIITFTPSVLSLAYAIKTLKSYNLTKSSKMHSTPQLGVIWLLNVHISGALVVWEYTKQYS